MPIHVFVSSLSSLMSLSLSAAAASGIEAFYSSVRISQLGVGRWNGGRAHLELIKL